MSRDSTLQVCLVTRDEPGTTGTSRYVEQLALELGQLGVAVTCRTTRPRGLAGRVLSLARPLGIDPATFLAQYPVWLGWPAADVYHLTVQTYASLLRWSRPPGPVVVTVHDIIPYLVQNDPRLNVYRHAVHRLFDHAAVRSLGDASLLIADSHWTAETVRRLPFGLPPVEVVPLGVRHDHFFPRPASYANLDRYGISGGQRYVLYVGSEDPRKDLETLWRAMAAVVRLRPGVLLVKAGRGHDPAERHRLSALTLELGLQDTVCFLDDVPEDDLPLLYGAAAVCAVPSRLEGFGLPALEALACGAPVVCATHGAAAEVVGSDALFFPPGDHELLGRAILTLLDEPPARRAARADAGIQQAKRYTWASTARQTLDCYRRALVRPELQ